MSIRAHHQLSGDCLDLRTANNGCPFCHKTFLRLGNHLPQCNERKGQVYSCYLSQKTLAKRSKAGKKTCSQCGKKFIRLDTHLKNSSTCRIIPTPMPHVESSSSSTLDGMTSSPTQHQSINTQVAVNSHHPISQGVCQSSEQLTSDTEPAGCSHQSKSSQHQSPLQLSLTKNGWQQMKSCQHQLFLQSYPVTQWMRRTGPCVMVCTSTSLSSLAPRNESR